jgi:hypothetical protein
MKFKKTIILGIFLLVLLTIFSVNANRNIALADGPTQITTWAELDNVRNNLSGDYILMNDLDETTAGYDTYASEAANAGAGWDPIGTQANPFTGSFDGDGHIISGLFINRPAGSRIGLFGYLNVADFENIGMEGVNITGGGSVGGLIGDSFNSNITNSYSTGDVIGTNNYIGGLVGNYSFGNITNSYSTASVSGLTTIGGLVGNYQFGNIINSYSTGSVSGSSNVGGLVGSNFSGSVTNSFYDSQTSGKSDTGKGTPKTTSEMKTQSTFTNAGWNFVDVWAMGSERNSGYAYLQSLAPIAIWTLTYTAGENGAIAGDTSQSVDDGEDGTAVTAVPDEGYSFVSWSDDSMDNPRTDLNVAGDITVTANFAINEVDEEENINEVSVDNTEEDSNVNSANSADSVVNNEVDSAERAKVISWAAFKYTESNKSCSERLKITIKGKHFNDDAKVYIGGKEALSVNVKNSKKLTAKFCLAKLTNNKTDKIRVVSVKNPDTKERKVNKQIDLNNILPEFFANDFSMQTTDGIKNIQTILVKLGYSDAEYITGFYGPITTEAVKKFQADHNIKQVGIVGPLTRAKLEEKINR